MRERLPRIIGAALVAIAALLYTVTFSVGPGQAALVESFGRISRVLSSPAGEGVHFKWPWPLQKVYKFDLRTRVLRSDLAEVATGDGQAIVIGPFVLWRIGDPRAFREAAAGDLQRAEALLRGPLSAACAEAFSRRRFAELVALPSGEAQRNRQGPVVLNVLEREIASSLAQEARAYGIEVEKVGFYQLLVPAEATKGIFDHMKRVKEEEASRLENVAKAEAERIRAEGQVQYEATLSEARKEAASIRAKARAQAAELLARCKEKELLVFLDKLEALKELLSQKTTLVLDTETPPLDVLGRLKVQEKGKPSAGGAGKSGGTGSGGGRKQ